ncbi:MAG: hypothetical protein KY475_10070 [Planctomycetes bacterium]|nr:hypothetical protein [Planctomycetota bacterium]
MTSLLDLIRPEEFLVLLVLIVLLVFIGQQIARPDALTYQQARRLAATVIVLYCAGGIFAWEPSGIADLLLIVVRALFAAGFVFGASSILLAIVHRLVGDPVEAVVTKYTSWRAECRRRVALERERREAAARERRQRAEQARLAAERERERQRLAEEETVTEQERLARSADARSEVIRFYDEHAPLLAASHPSALFRTQLQTRFPDAVAPEDAWRAAQDLMAEMLPLIRQAREQERAEHEEQRQREEAQAEEERRRREPEERRQSIHRLTEWYEEEKASIEDRLAPGPERDVILHELYDRYDQLMKEALRELTP